VIARTSYNWAGLYVNNRRVKLFMAPRNVRNWAQVWAAHSVYVRRGNTVDLRTNPYTISALDNGIWSTMSAQLTIR